MFIFRGRFNTGLLLTLLFSAVAVHSQTEHAPVQHPVYQFLLRAEARGLLPHFSLSSLPLQRQEIIAALTQIRSAESRLSHEEVSTLELYETEFEIKKRSNAVVIYSPSDSAQVLSQRMFGSDEKFIYRYKDSTANINISPLGSFEAFAQSGSGKKQNAQLGTLGARISGSVGSSLGYYLQATNSALFGGDKSLVLQNEKYKQNIKFAELGSDMDFSESHIRFQSDWFYAVIGRETQLLGAGLRQKLFISETSPAFDALSLGARFSNFEYRFTHASLLALPESVVEAGFNTYIPYKFAAMHRFALKPSWGEVAFWEGIIYSDRFPDLAYLNPLSFFKSLEHALRDRDNSIMGMDGTVRIFDGLQLKGTFLLDDIIFSKIGTGFWSNKTAWNISISAALPFNLDVGFEYSRIEPYTYSHFNTRNSYTNDGKMLGSYLLPNSDAFVVQTNYWFGGRYPVFLNCFFMRHGENVYNENGELLKNVGADPLITRRPPDFETGRPADPETVTFLDGILKKTFGLEVGGGVELARGFNLKALYRLTNSGSGTVHFTRIVFSFEDF